jgi:hypothetical protein
MNIHDAATYRRQAVEDMSAAHQVATASFTNILLQVVQVVTVDYYYYYFYCLSSVVSIN